MGQTVGFQAGESIEDEADAVSSCKRRLEHLKECDTSSEVEQKQWRKTRLNRMLVEYFLRAGYYNTALQLAEMSNIQVRAWLNIFNLEKQYF